MHETIFSPLAIAPMIDWTNSPFRVFMRLLAPQALLYTEMQTTGAIQNNPKRALAFQACEHPIALQLGGSDPQALAAAAILAEEQGYDEINLNLGCPSDRVQAGRFGACLMTEGQLVAQCIKAMKEVVSIPVTAKTRIGIDQQDSYVFFKDFAQQLIDAGCQKLIVHARKAWLRGLNPKQNRTIPPVHYEYAYRIKQDFPEIPVIINGNITQIDAIHDHLQQVDGVMLGRLACDNPFRIAEIHAALYPHLPQTSRIAVYSQYLAFAHEQLTQGVPISLLLKPLYTLTHGLAGASQWKKRLMQVMQTKQFALMNDLSDYLAELEEG
ncbi:MAG: tRNA dihydrouridine(20/20a) synthase DusA [Legionella sp.]|nr:MAG: tRNA dihydrouridine(20/20a) synthase DusA [Legionella sp.]